MHRTTSSAIAFAGTVAAAVQAAALMAWQAPADDPAPAVAVAALALAPALQAIAGAAHLSGAAFVARPDLQHGWVPGSHAAAGDPPCATP